MYLFPPSYQKLHPDLQTALDDYSRMSVRFFQTTASQRVTDLQRLPSLPQTKNLLLILILKNEYTRCLFVVL